MSAKRGLTKMSGPEGKTGQNQKRGIRLNSLSNKLIPGDQEDQGLEKNGSKFVQVRKLYIMALIIS